MSSHQPPPNAQARFSNRVANYVRYRPGYPPETLDILRQRAGLRAEAKVADIGSGTGISAALLLGAGCEVFAVEPNAEMRQAAELALGSQAHFHSLAAPAEATTLPTGSMDLIVSAQAFHWFDRARVRPEFSRILKPGGHVALIWNVRQTERTAFLRDYEALLCRFAIDYAQVRHENVDAGALRDFFAGGHFEQITLPNNQRLDFDGLRGRLMSSSYAPAEGHPQHVAMLAELQRLFDLHQQNGKVEVLYDTEIYIGQ